VFLDQARGLDRQAAMEALILVATDGGDAMLANLGHPRRA